MQLQFYSFIISLMVATLLVACNGNGDYVQPESKPLMEAVYASGYVASENEYQAFSQVDGYITEKFVTDGDAVKKNDPLFTIQSDQQNARYRIAKENYELAQQNSKTDSPVLSELNTVRKSAKTKLEYDSTNFVRYTNLIKKNATSQVEYDRVRLIFENSKNDYQLADSRYKKTLNQVNLEYKNAENQFKIARDESSRYTIRSQVDGIVFKTFKEKEELVRRTEAIAVLGSTESFYLQLNVDELDIQRIKKGQDVLVKIDAYPNHVFKATINRIYPLVDSRQQALRVDAALTEKLPGNFSGLALEANIIIRKTEKSLIIPKVALLPGDSVILKNEKGEQKVKITIGISTFDEVEVLEGLDATSLVKVKH